MPRELLNDRACRNARADGKPLRLADGGGLYLNVSPSGAKSWQFRYRDAAAKWQTATLGRYPDLSLADARAAASSSRVAAAEGHHLTALARVRRAENSAASAMTFEAVADSWMTFEARRRAWTADYRNEVAASLAKHARALNALPIASITAAHVYPVLDAVERSAPFMASKVAFRVHRILDHAVIIGAMTANTIPRRPRARIAEKNMPAIVSLAELGTILRAAENAEACNGVRRAHALAAFTAQRLGVIVTATWDQFDLAEGTWRIPREAMKVKHAGREDFLCPLPPVLLNDLRKWHSLAGKQLHVCPAPRDPEAHVVGEALEKFYRRTLGLAGQHSPHSWRAALKTLAKEARKDRDAVEAQLDHVLGSRAEAAYDRSQLLDARRELLTWWESELLGARDETQ